MSQFRLLKINLSKQIYVRWKIEWVFREITNKLQSKYPLWQFVWLCDRDKGKKGGFAGPINDKHR